MRQKMRSITHYRWLWMVGLGVIICLLVIRHHAVEAGLPTTPPRLPEAPLAPTRLTPVGSFEVPGTTAQAVAIQGQYAYVGFGAQLTVLNISQPATPQQVGQITLASSIVRLAAAGSHVYALTNGLQIVNIANPSAPNVVGQVAVTGELLDLAVTENYAYIAAGSAGLRIIDVSNPTAPHEAGAYTQSTARAVEVAGSYAYIIDNSALRVVDISTPGNPQHVGFYQNAATHNVDYDSSARHIAVTKGYAYVIGWLTSYDEKFGVYSQSGWLDILTLTTPSQPKPVGNSFYWYESNSNGSYGPFAMAASAGQAVYVVAGAPDNSGRLWSFAVTAPTSPQQDTTSINSGGDIATDGNYVYVAATQFRIFKSLPSPTQVAPQVSQTASAIAFNPSEMLTYTLRVKNIDTRTLQQVAITDTLPALQRPVAVTSASSQCALQGEWGGQATCALSSLAYGAEEIITLTAQVAAQAGVGQGMTNTILASAQGTEIATQQLTTYAQDCHARVDANPTEYTQVPAAIAVAPVGAVIKVAGACLGQEIRLDKNLTLRGGYTATDWNAPPSLTTPTLLNALRRHPVIEIADAVITVEGFYITGGQSGLSEIGDGVDVRGTTTAVTLTHNLISNNTSTGIVANQVKMVTLNHNTVISNELWGIKLWQVTTATLNYNTIAHHLTGIGQFDTTLIADGNQITNNYAGFSMSDSFAYIANTVFADNTATGLDANCTSKATLLHTTFANNKTGFIAWCSTDNYSTFVFTNTLIAGHETAIIAGDGLTVTMDGVLWGANAWANNTLKGGEGTLLMTHAYTGAPGFADQQHSDYHLTFESEAINRGISTALDHDMDGNPRPINGSYDLGADEFYRIALTLSQRAIPDPVVPGTPLTLTLAVTNTGSELLHVTITDTLPLSTTLLKFSDNTIQLPDNRIALTWTTTLTASAVWTREVTLLTAADHDEPLANHLEATAREGASAHHTLVVNRRYIYLPTILRLYD